MTEHLKQTEIDEETDVLALLRKMQQHLIFLEKKIDTLIANADKQPSYNSDRPAFKPRRDFRPGGGRPGGGGHHRRPGGFGGGHGRPDRGPREHGSGPREFSGPPRNFSQDRDPGRREKPHGGGSGGGFGGRKKKRFFER